MDHDGPAQSSHDVVNSGDFIAQTNVNSLNGFKCSLNGAFGLANGDSIILHHGDSVMNAYDESFDVNDDEAIATPRSSCTSDETQALSAASFVHRILSNSGTLPTLLKSETHNLVTKSLGDVALRPCQYTLEKRYDESFPVHSRRSIRDTLKISHNHVRPLENLLTSPIIGSAALPRMASYSSSSGSLIGNVDSLTFGPDNLVMGNICDPLVTPNDLNGHGGVDYIDWNLTSTELLSLSQSVKNGSNGCSVTAEKPEYSDIAPFTDNWSSATPTDSNNVISIPTTAKSKRKANKGRNKAQKHIKMSGGESNSHVKVLQNGIEEEDTDGVLEQANLPTDSEITAATVYTIADVDANELSDISVSVAIVAEDSVRIVVDSNHAPTNTLSNGGETLDDINMFDKDFTLVVNRKQKRNLKRQQQQIQSPTSVIAVNGGISNHNRVQAAKPTNNNGRPVPPPLVHNQSFPTTNPQHHPHLFRPPIQPPKPSVQPLSILTQSKSPPPPSSSSSTNRNSKIVLDNKPTAAVSATTTMNTKDSSPMRILRTNVSSTTQNPTNSRSRLQHSDHHQRILRNFLLTSWSSFTKQLITTL